MDKQDPNRYYRQGERVTFTHYRDGDFNNDFVLSGVVHCHRHDRDFAGYIEIYGDNGRGYLMLPSDVYPVPSDPYATYDGGKSQYDADLATLDAAAELSKSATGGEWELDSSDNVFSTTPPQASDDYPRYNAIVEGGVEGAVWFTNPSDRDLIVNAARVARAWARMSAYLKGKGVL